MKIPGLNEQRAEIIWEMICYMGAGGEIIRTGDIIDNLIKHYPNEATPKAWLLSWQAFHTWARANHDEFYGPASRLVKLSHGRYQLQDEWWRPWRMT